MEKTPRESSVGLDIPQWLAEKYADQGLSAEATARRDAKEVTEHFRQRISDKVAKLTDNA